ncbi:anaerobic sulfatase maturase [Thaumasiovibrio subtropicus]|uniref:anaerobic sulfatase maturase n=1 Tax=Thaumasiovibrio subtropicus TaxID=1891207 RepID=UPI000B35AD7F|nr:anaerobic sulfatase maturase [Thaumasiovibrio subtropicus]
MSTATQVGCHVMAKPSGSVCNIDCHYCFYLEKEKLYPDRQAQWRMSDETLETYVRQQIEAQPGPHVEFAWQGGEPTLMGLPFYERVIALCEKYGKGKTIQHAFQTNAILLNDDWCQFFAKHNFLIGVSIDGPAELHDHYRVTRSGKPTHEKVMAGIVCLKKHGVAFNTLTVINSVNVKHPKALYQFLTEIGSTFLQFIPLVEREAKQQDTSALSLVLPGESMATVTDWSVPSWQYGEFLNQVFDVWVRRDVGRVFVQMFDTTLASWCGQPSGVCVFSETCGHAFALEANGDLYSCDHYVYPEYLLGNIHQISIKELNEGDAAHQFGQDKRNTLTPDCQRCDFRFACHGGCPKHRFDVSPSGFPNHNYFCQGYKHFFKHSAPYMAKMRELLEQGRQAADIMLLVAQADRQRAQQTRQAAGRNAPCPCGSGKKHKRCCG